MLLTYRDKTAEKRPRIRGWRHAGDLYETHAGEPLDLPSHVHQDYQIAISTRVPGIYTCGGKKVSCVPGDIIIFNPGEVHGAGRCERLGDEPSKLIYLAPARVSTMLSQTLDHQVDDHIFTSRTTGHPHLVSLLHSQHALSQARSQDLESDSVSLHFFILLWLRLNPDRASSLPDLDARAGAIRRAREYIHAHFADNILLESLAMECGMSPFHLCRTFTKAVGVPPHAYQTSVRIDTAKKMLANGERGAAVAAATGFFDQSHFAKKFKQLVGVSPGQYAAAVMH
jgi:AraC-like DNA-binding protein